MRRAEAGGGAASPGRSAASVPGGGAAARAEAGEGGPRRPAAFLDRDGTIVVERHYLRDPDGVELIPGAAEAIRRLRAAGFAVVVVTNQSGIARGLYGEEDFAAVQRRVDSLLAAEGAGVDGVYHCPHHPEVTGPCECRKPAPGLYLRAARELGLDLARSAFIGDRLKDVLPAAHFGGLGILVRTGYGAEEARHAPAGIEAVADLGEAADRVLAGGRMRG